MGWVYILQCADKSYYVGSTRNLEQRFYQHQTGKGANYTASRLPVELVFAEKIGNIGEAFEREKQIQGWSRAKREALIEGNWDKLPALSKKYWRKTSKTPPNG